ncbi:nucleotidyltransferase domain-containing protein [Candidatus Micrarchaeota archaeon]|nr:nucleotidyltransferase domain-containing protein [Candidatus Micrarchaeota archaeon]
MLENYALIKVLKEILSHPNKKYSVRETAKLTHLSVNASKYSLDYMFSHHLVTLEKIGKTYQYRANLANPVLRQWKILFSVQELQALHLVENLLKTKKRVFSIVLYGSVAIGSDDDQSDVDILVIADVDVTGKKQLLTALTNSPREINAIIYSPTEWRKKAAIDKVFYENVIINSITLYGEKPVVL